MNKQQPLVSIITIVFNGEKHLQQTIESVLGQSYSNIEYIIIDGGSKDSSVSIIEKYSAQLAYWTTEPDKGISDAFNKGIKKTKGQIIGIINADDWYEADTVQQVVTAINKSDIVYGDLRLMKNEKPDFILKGDHNLLNTLMSLNHPTVFVRKSIYEKYGLFNENLKCAMDYELMLRFKLSNCSFKYIPATLANMRWEGMSDKKWIEGCKETLKVKNVYFPKKRIRNTLFFFKHVIGIALPKYLEQSRLSFLVKAYRKRYALQKKIY